MYNFFLATQCVGNILLFVLFILILFRVSSQNQLLLGMTALSALLNNSGYLMELQSQSQEAALLSVKVSYLGKSYIFLCLLLFVLHYCQIRHSKRVTMFLLGLHTILLCCVLSCERQPLFYSAIGYSADRPYSGLILQHGPVYRLFILFTVGELLFSILCCVYQYARSRDRNEQIQLIHIAVCLFLPIPGYLIWHSGLAGGYDTTTLAYLTGTIFLMFISIRYNKADAIEIVKENIIDQISDGILLLDQSGRLLFGNISAFQIYPGFRDNGTDEQALIVLNQLSTCDKYIFANDHVYSVHRQSISRYRTTLGMLFRLEDVTDSYRYTHQLESDVQEKTQHIRRIQSSLIDRFANIAEARDDITGKHSRHAVAYVSLIAREFQKMYNNGIAGKDPISDEYVEQIVHAAPLHDIGKIAIPDSILQKPGKLTPEEFAIIKTHSEKGAQIIDQIMEDVDSDESLAIAKEMAQYHHERWDGTGYPAGLSGTRIPLPARIMSVADVYDALLSVRSYKEALPPEKCYQIILEGAGTQFDPTLVAAFAAVFPTIRQLQ